MSIREDDLTTTWRILLGCVWLAGFFAYVAVWQASVQIGIGTWWIGPRADPAPAVLRIVPFALVLTMTLMILYNTRQPSRSGMVGALLAAAIAVPDFSRSVGLGVAELTIAALLMLGSLASLTGRYRLQPRNAGDVEAALGASVRHEPDTPLHPWEPPTAADAELG